MRGSTGLAGLVVTALVAALVAFAVAALLGPPAPPPGPAQGSASGTAALEREVAALRREVEELRAAGPRSGGGRAARGSSPAGAGAAESDPAAPAADGAGTGEALPASRDELLTLIDDRIADARETAEAEGGGPTGWKPPPPKPRLTIEEAGAEMGLTPFEIDAVHRAYEEAELEMITSVMGTADMDAIKEELKAAKEDPDRKAALVTKAVGNVIRNLGRVVTIEDRRDRDLRKVLSPEQMTRLKGYNLKPTMADPELEGILKDAFGNR